MDEAHGAIALTCTEQWIGFSALGHPAELALPIGLLALALCVWHLLRRCLSIELLGQFRPGAHLRHVDVNRLKCLIFVLGGALRIYLKRFR